jgi:serine-type D-Ala-D-Ala carboxypeptidase/endopeptidase (penicillin-binding protein 4)
MTASMSGEPSRRSVLGLLGAASLAAGAGHGAQRPARASDPPAPPPGSVLTSAATPTGLAAAIQEIIDQPQFQGARWAMEFSAPGSTQPIYSMSSDQVAVAASAAKVFTAGTVFSTLGPDYRFRTPVYGTGPVANGVLDGDLVLVASGDLLLSNRIQPDGSLALPIPDHSYDLPDTVPIHSDPLRPIHHLADQVAARGIRRIGGRILVDTSLFAQAQTSIGVSAAGLVTISPIMINDNIVDVTVTPGGEPGAPAALRISPQTGYVHIVNAVTTVPSSGAPAAALSFVNDVTNPDGTHTVELTGEIPMSTPHLYRAYYVPDPARFAQMAFAEALTNAGVDAPAGTPATADFSTLSSHYTARNRLAEHASPPVSEQVKVMLKTSSNVHTAMWEYVDGAIAGHDSTDPADAYDQLQAALFQAAGLDASPSGYTPAFFATFLAHMTRRPYFAEYRDALPIMGKDGDLADVQAGSPATGHVYAKTGTGLDGTASSPVVDKALAGFIQPPNGRWIVFAQFMDMSATSADFNTVASTVTEAMGEIATAVYQSS